MFRALDHKNFRLFFIGQSISLVGTWMQQLASSWLIYRLTGSAFLLGAVQFAGLVPTFFIAPFAGVLADRWDRRRILVVTQTLAMLQALALAFLVLANAVTIKEILLLSSFLGLVNGFDMPVRQAFMVDMVEEKDDLGNAIALNSSMFNGARLLGPSVSGVLIAAFGEGICFLLNGISYAAVIMALLNMTVVQSRISKKPNQVFKELKEGFAYSVNFAPIKTVILLIALISMMAVPYQILMPVFAKDILHGGPHTLGFLMAASGAGALAGALYLASRKNVLGLGRIIPLAAAIFGAGLVAFSFSHSIGLSFLLMFVTGFGVMTVMASSNTLLQTIVDDAKRGRVMSFYTMAFMGTAPVGSLLAGWLAGRIGAPNTLIISGVFSILGALLFARKLPSLREILRPLYLEMGMIS